MSQLPELEFDRTSAPSFLRQIARRRRSADIGERCELCNAELAPVHPHLLDPKRRQTICACDGCAMLFCGQEGAHYLRVPRRIRAVIDFTLPDPQWESLMIPINLAFFYFDTRAGRMMAMYPSPAGAVESLLSLGAWTEISSNHPILSSMEPDVEAFLVNRVSVTREYYIVPIDECFRLVGIIRMHWRGLSGGADVWKEIDSFFAGLKSRSTEVRDPANLEQSHA
jgi:hypothetical protein